MTKPDEIASFSQFSVVSHMLCMPKTLWLDLWALEPELKLFKVWEFGSWFHWRWWWFVARLSPKLQTALVRVLDKLERKEKSFHYFKYLDGSPSCYLIIKGPLLNGQNCYLISHNAISSTHPTGSFCILTPLVYPSPHLLNSPITSLV